MEDSKIIEFYFDRDEKAISESEKKYGGYCKSIAFNILRNKEDLEECVSDTWLKTWNSVPPTHPKSLKAFFAKLTRNGAFNIWEKESAKKRGSGELTMVLDELAECIPDSKTVEDEIDLREITSLINSFLYGIPERERNIFIRRYFFTESVKEIAKRYMMKPGAVSTALFRTREKLRTALEKEGYTP